MESGRREREGADEGLQARREDVEEVGAVAVVVRLEAQLRVLQQLRELCGSSVVAWTAAVQCRGLRREEATKSCASANIQRKARPRTGSDTVVRRTYSFAATVCCAACECGVRGPINRRLGDTAANFEHAPLFTASKSNTTTGHGSSIDSLHHGCSGAPSGTVLVRQQVQRSFAPVKRLIACIADSLFKSCLCRCPAALCRYSPIPSAGLWFAGDSQVRVRLQLHARPFRIQADMGWSRRLMALLAGRQRHFHLMNWFSTIGGGYSQLAQQHHNERTQTRAAQAGKYALKMMKVANRLGDTEAMVRCGLYVALALSQQDLRPQGRTILIGVRRWARAHDVDVRNGKLRSVYLQVRHMLR